MLKFHFYLRHYGQVVGCRAYGRFGHGGADEREVGGRIAENPVEFLLGCLGRECFLLPGEQFEIFGEQANGCALRLGIEVAGHDKGLRLGAQAFYGRAGLSCDGVGILIVEVCAGEREAVAYAVKLKLTHEHDARLYVLGIGQVHLLHLHGGVLRQYAYAVVAACEVDCTAVEPEHAGEFGQTVDEVYAVVALGDLSHRVDVHLLKCYEVGIGGAYLRGEALHRGKFAEAQVVGHDGELAFAVFGCGADCSYADQKQQKYLFHVGM